MITRLPNHLPHLSSQKQLVSRDIIADMDEPIGKDIQPLRVAILNLMPDKIRTEMQFARVLNGIPLHIELSLLVPSSHTPKHTPSEHIRTFYRKFWDVRNETFDGLIITGAPLEHLEFEDVDYWSELVEIFDWTRSHVQSSFFICWAAQAALYYFHKVPKQILPSKRFGVFVHKITDWRSYLVRGFADEFVVPVSRYSEIRIEDISNIEDLTVVSESSETGICLISDIRQRRVYMFNHLEYDADTLEDEYRRDLTVGLSICKPKYYSTDSGSNVSVNTWNSSAYLLFSNWLRDIAQSQLAVSSDRNATLLEKK